MKKIKVLGMLSLVVVFLLGFSFATNANERKYATTRMIGCTDYDVVIGDQVRAACNSNYEIKNKTIHSEVPLDMNGRSIGNYYGTRPDDGENESFACPNGYVMPLYSDFLKAIPDATSPNIAKLKLSAGGLYSSYREDVSSFDTHGYYRIRALQKKLFVLGVGSYVSDSSTTVGQFYSLRCIRVAPATQEEKLGKLTPVQQENTIDYGVSTQTEFGKSTNQNFVSVSTSTDEYVNAKLNEINDCFYEIYSGQLANINQTIKTLTETKIKSTDISMQKKYAEAIRKLIEIRELFVKKYSFLFGNTYGSSINGGLIIPAKLLTKGVFTIAPSLDKTEFAYKIKFNAKNINHVYAIVLIIADLYTRGYDINSMYSTIDKVFMKQTGKSFGQTAAKLKTSMKNEVILTKIQDVKSALEGIVGSDGADVLAGLGFELNDNAGNNKIGYGDVMGNGVAALTDSMNQFLNELDKSRNGFGNNKKGGGYDDTYGGDTAGFGDERGQTMAGGFYDVVGYSTNVKTSNNGSYGGSHFQYRSVNSNDGGFRQGSKRSSVDSNGNTVVHERIVSNNIDGSTEVYEGSVTNGNRQGNYTKTDENGKKVAEKTVGGSAPTSSDGGTPGEDDTPESSGSPTGSINPEKDNGGMAPGVFIGLLNLLGKSAFVNSFNGSNGVINNGNVDNGQETGGPVNDIKISGGGVINWGEDYCSACNNTMGGINPGAYKGGQVTNRGGR